MKFNSLYEQSNTNDLLERCVSKNIFSKYTILRIENGKLVVDIETRPLSQYEEFIFEELYNNDIIINKHTFVEQDQYYNDCMFSNMDYFPKILNCGYVLSFRGNTFLHDISNLPQIYNHNFETMQFAGCSALENFTGLRDIAEDGTPIKYTLRLASTKIKNLSTIPRNAINKMYMGRTQHFDSYKGVSDFTKLQSIEYDTNDYDLKYEISNSIELLLCKSLFQLYIPTGHTMFLIIKKHFHDDKEEYIMDCAVELIDNGFEKAAEL